MPASNGFKRWSNRPPPPEVEIAKQGARNAVKYGLKDGKLHKPDHCEDCQEPKAPYQLQGHHYLGYDREHWLDVRWLCQRCHSKQHPQIRTTQDLMARLSPAHDESGEGE